MDVFSWAQVQHYVLIVSPGSQMDTDGQTLDREEAMFPCALGMPTDVVCLFPGFSGVLRPLFQIEIVPRAL